MINQAASCEWDIWVLWDCMINQAASCEWEIWVLWDFMINQAFSCEWEIWVLWDFMINQAASCEWEILVLWDFMINQAFSCEWEIFLTSSRESSEFQSCWMTRKISVKSVINVSQRFICFPKNLNSRFRFGLLCTCNWSNSVTIFVLWHTHWEKIITVWPRSKPLVGHSDKISELSPHSHPSAPYNWLSVTWHINCIVARCLINVVYLTACPFESLSLSHWYPGSGVVLNCIDSWSLHPYLLLSCHDLFVCLFLYVHSTIFQLCGTVLPGFNQY